jgi:hypothetical protein
MIKYLKECSDAELASELKRRKTVARANKKVPPQPLFDFELRFDTIVTTCHEMITECADKGMMRDNWETDVAEVTLEALYGPTIWTWLIERE